MDAPSIGRADLLSGEARSLIEALNAELSALYPEPGGTHFRLDPEEVAPGRGAFLVCREGGVPAGCGAVRLLEGGDAEVKRMYVVPGRRGHGLGGRILAALEAEARALGARRIVLESGVRQGPALALYATAGFTSIEPYGEFLRPELEAHVKAGISVYMGKDLGPGGRP